MRARRDGTCPACKGKIKEGEEIIKSMGRWVHAACANGATVKAPTEEEVKSSQATVDQIVTNMIGRGAPVHYDDRGFNKPDHGPGKRWLAGDKFRRYPSAWCKMADRLFKYKRQITSMDLWDAFLAAKDVLGRWAETEDTKREAAMAEAKRTGAPPPNMQPKIMDKWGSTWIAVKFPYDKATVAAVKALPKRRWDQDRKAWLVPLGLGRRVASILDGTGRTVEGLVAKAILDLPGVQEASKEEEAKLGLARAATSHQAGQDGAEVVARVEGALAGKLPPGAALYPFQAVGVGFMDTNKGQAIIADEMGTGKTIQALAYLAHCTAQGVDPFPAVVVAPAVIKTNWAREARKWLAPVGVTEEEVFICNSNHPAPETAKVVIINFDLMHRRVKVEDTKEGRRKVTRIKDVVGLPVQPGTVIVDECFPGETPVLTNRGWIPIREIVDHQMDVCVASMNLSNNEIEWKTIRRRISQPIHKPLVRVEHEKGEIICTTNHRIWTTEGYRMAGTLQSGAELRVVSKKIRDASQRKIDGSFLHKSVRNEKPFFFTASPRGTVTEAAIAPGSEKLRMVRQVVPVSIKGHEAQQREAVLLSFLRSQLEDVVPGTTGTGPAVHQNSSREEQGIAASGCFQTIETTQQGSRIRSEARGWAKTLSKGTPRMARRPAWRQWEDDAKAAEDFGGGPWPSCGIRSANRADTQMVRGLADTLQGGYCRSRSDVGHRSGWDQSQDCEGSGIRSAQGCRVERSRVVSVTVLERGCSGEATMGVGADRVYNLEVADNHNYFASGVLVSNCHKCKNQKTKRTRSTMAYAQRAERRLMLSGTPLLNRPLELWPVLQCIRPNEFGSFWTFAQRYCGAHRTRWGWDFGGASNVEELRNRMHPMMLRRTKDQVLTELPPKRRVRLSLELSNLDEYQEAEEDLIAWLVYSVSQGVLEQAAEEGINQDVAAEEAQAQAKAKAAAAQRAEHLVRMNTLRVLAGRGKVEAAVEWIADMWEADPDRKLVVWSHHKEVVEAMRLGVLDKFKDVGIALLTGDTPQAKRQAGIDAFQDDPKCKLFLGTTTAGGIGVTLTAAHDVLFLEREWVPGDEEQAEDRCHRIGATGPSVTCWYAEAEGTIDQDFAELVEEKRALFMRLIDGKAAMVKGRMLAEVTAQLIKRAGKGADSTTVADVEAWLRGQRTDKELDRYTEDVDHIVKRIEGAEEEATLDAIHQRRMAGDDA